MKILSLFLNNEIRTGGHRRLLDLYENFGKSESSVFVILNNDLQYVPQFFLFEKVSCKYHRKKIPPISSVFKKCVAHFSDTLTEKIKQADVLLVFGETHLAAALYLKNKYDIPVIYGHRSNTVRECLINIGDKSASIGVKITGILTLIFYRHYEKRIARQCDCIVMQSPYDKKDFCTRNPSATPKVHIIRGNIGLPHFLPQYDSINKSESLHKIVFVGTLGTRKGLRHLLDAMDILQSRGINTLELDIIGPGENIEEWRQWLVTHKMAERIHLYGRVSDPFPYIGQADLLVVPSDFDSYPDTVLEGLYTGTPVIGSITGGIPDMLQYEELLFPIQDPSAIANRIEKLFRNNDFYMQVRSLCSKRKDFFTFDWIDEWKKLAEKIISEKRKT